MVTLSPENCSALVISRSGAGRAASTMKPVGQSLAIACGGPG